MKSVHESTASVGVEKRVWQSPRLQEVGNLRDFVREGNAFGKSGPGADGTTSGNNEAMIPMN